MLKRLIIFLLFVQLSFGQTKEGVELCLEYQKVVSGFTSEKEANEALDKILNVIGASKNFTLIPCDNINNALAITFKGDRYILFDSEFMNQITQLTNDWSSIFILAHEVGHHINGHTREALMISVLDDITLEKKRKEELEADEFASFILAKLGASLDDIKAGIELITTNDDDTYSTHPSKNKRLLAINKGYNRAANSIVNKKSKKTNTQSNGHRKQIKINSWTYNDETLDGVLKELESYESWNSKDPFEKKEYIERRAIPDIKREIKVKSSEGKKTAELFITLDFYQRENNRTKNYGGVNLSTKDGVYIFPLIKLEFSDFVPISVDYFDSKQEFNDFLNESEARIEKAKEIGLIHIPELKARRRDIQLKYIIDDDSGEFLVSLPGLEFDLLSLDEIKIKPSSLTYYNEEDLIIFFERLKKGKKLYIKLGQIYCYIEKKFLTNETFTLQGEEGKETYYLNDLFDKETVYEFDLTGSSKALKL